ncbi:ORF74 [Retroperitoneal fibromatosis-associated herpesvirus]|uniref:ORF74 n=1 Tax=Retroperitoneal fibromatosis-associated herpesvirus TaxID=111469 RepID=U5NM54_9GAMA|nr:ORF74 [Retroperitoneal fibromatosis-associated herpesvirus]AGY30762.1 ORF74 [Retroperitoneal fibromatosis-associated herpesvirus]
MAGVDFTMDADLWNYSDYDFANYSVNITWDDTVCDAPQFLSPSLNACILGLIFLLNVIGNGTVTYIFCQHMALAKAVDVLLMGLCLNSLCLSVSLAITLAMHFLPTLTSGILCWTELFFYDLYLYLDIFSVVCISLLRFLLVAYSNSSWPKNPRFGCVLAAASLVVAAGLAGNACRYRSQVIDPNTGAAICYEDAGNATLEWKLHVRTVGVAVGFCLPLSLLILFYAMTWYVVKRTKLRAKRQVKGVIFSVVCLFFICCIPYQILNLVDTMLRRGMLSDSCRLRGALNVGLAFTSLLQALYSATVPVVYSCLGSLFRRRVYGMCSNIRRSLMSSSS